MNRENLKGINVNNNINNNDEDEDDVGLIGDDLLFTGAPINVRESMLLILTLLINHNVTMTCVEDIIRVIQLHCPREDLVKNSLYKFKKYFSLEQDNQVIDNHFYCTTCERELESIDDNCPSCENTKNSYFITSPILKLLKEMFNRETFFALLQHRFQRIVNNNVIADIYDGSIYKYWFNNGFLQDPNNISFSWYTDGVPHDTFFLTINELPFFVRKLRENTLLLGLWFGKSKPNPNLFMSILISGTADTPAKSDFLNFKKFNGAFGCMTCCTERENVETEHGSTHVYPYEEQVVMRTSANCIKWSQTATEENPLFGVKGPTALANYMPDFIGGLAIDRMHCVDGGVIKKILTLLFDYKYRDEGFSLYHMIETVDARLLAIKPPRLIHWMSRSISEMIHWKASELRVWAFYYSLPVLNGILRPDLFENYQLLITACAILTKLIEQIEQNSYSVGTYVYLDEIPPNLVEMLNNTNVENITKILKYFKILRNKKLYVSNLYPKELQTRSDGIKYSINNRSYLGLIERQICGCPGAHFAVTQQVITEELFTVSSDNFTFNTLEYLHKYFAGGRYLLVPIVNIDTVCIIMNVEEEMYLGLPLNSHELE
ncbi:Protein of unknown function, partial [Cotesia congregata]